MRVTDAPVARSTDPLTSHVAGENRAAREASERVVLDALASMDGPASDHEIESWAGLFGVEYTPQRLRTARKQLLDRGVVRDAGVRDGASPTGRRAHVWAAVAA